MPKIIKGIAAAATLALFALSAGSAMAQPQTIQLAASNSWIADEHAASQSSPADACIAYTKQAPYMFGIRVASAEIFGSPLRIADAEVVFMDQNWSLPAGVRGPLLLGVGTYDLTLEVTGNTSNMILAPITEANLRGLISAMHNESAMTVTPGNGAAVALSLIGSNVATTAFRTCAGIAGPVVGGQAVPFNKTTNPFQ